MGMILERRLYLFEDMKKSEIFRGEPPTIQLSLEPVRQIYESVHFVVLGK